MGWYSTTQTSLVREWHAAPKSRSRWGLLLSWSLEFFRIFFKRTFLWKHVPSFQGKDKDMPLASSLSEGRTRTKAWVQIYNTRKESCVRRNELCPAFSLLSIFPLHFAFSCDVFARSCEDEILSARRPEVLSIDNQKSYGDRTNSERPSAW